MLVAFNRFIALHDGAAVEILDQKEDQEVERVRFLGHQVKGERCSI